MADAERVLQIGDVVSCAAANDGDVVLIDVKERGKSDQVRLLFPLNEVGIFIERLLLASDRAAQIRRHHGSEEDAPVLPCAGLRVLPAPQIRSLTVHIQLSEGVSIPVALTLEQAHQLAASLLQTVQELDADPGLTAH
jgi:hypothetical protein